MKKVMTICVAIMMILFVSSVASAGLTAASQAGGDRLVALQNNDGGWDWPLDDGNPSSTSPVNTVSPITMGLAQAYLRTNDANQYAALQTAGSYFLTKTNNFSPCDGYLAKQLDDIFGGTTYLDYVKTNFYDQLYAGTYEKDGNGTYYDTADYIESIRTKRATTPNLAAWDIGMGLYAAVQAGADTTEWINATKAEINELDANDYYDVLGLAGGILGLASAGVDFDPTAGEHQNAGSVSDLADILVGYQLNSGGFTWNAGYVIENDDNECVQETAYAILALMEFNETTYADVIQDAQDYLITVQLGTGGWENYVGGGENNEITGEALWAIPEPATLSLLVVGGIALIRRRRK